MPQMKLDIDLEDRKHLLTMAPHTRVKHEILERYLKAWFPIMSKSARTRGRIVLYIDGFAGPGEYSQGDIGSPIIALDCLVNHQLKDQMLTGEVTFIFIFIEKGRARAKMLKEAIDSKFPELPECIRYTIVKGEFVKEMSSILSQTADRLPPTFAFIDPFGYTLPMSLISKIMHNERCEVLINYMSGSVLRFAGVDQRNDQKFDDLFACGDWREIDNYSGEERRELVLNLYKSQLCKQTGSRYIQTFEMRNHHNQVCYDLIYATNSPKGMEVMKEAMWKADPSGTYCFSDAWKLLKNQASLDDFTDEKICEGFETSEAARLVHERFHGEKVSVEGIKWFVILETNFLFRRACLKMLEDEGKILSVVKGDLTKRKKGTFPEGSIVTFSS